MGAALSAPTHQSPPYLGNVDFWNNIVVAGVGIKALSRTSSTERWTDGFRSDRNVFSSARSRPFWLRNAGATIDPVTFSVWQNVPLDQSSRLGDPLFVPGGDHTTQPGSPAGDMALPVANHGVPRCAPATPNPPDIGFRESCP